MTDDELLEVIRTKSPEELTLVEIDQLRRRMAHSPQLREAMASRLEMEQYLSGALGNMRVLVDEIVAHARPASTVRVNGVLPLLGGLLCLLLVGFIGTVLVLALTNPPVDSHRPGDLAAAADVQPAAIPPGGGESIPPKTPRNETAEHQQSKATAGKSGSTDQPPPPSPPEENTAANKPPEEPADPPPTVEPAKPAEPWDLPAAAEAHARPATQAMFGLLDRRTNPPGEAELRRWFADVPGEGHGIAQRPMHGVQCGQIDGCLRLRAPWKPQTALRMSLYEYNQLKLHFWNGMQGITLQFYEHPNQTWAAYRTAREANRPKPATFALVATDEDRYWRTNPVQPATFELRHENGLLILSRGDVRVLSAPFEQPPTEVYTEGRALFRQLAVVPAAELPPEPAQRPVAFDVPQPAELKKWIGELPEGAAFDKLPDGRVELIAEKNKTPSWVAFTLPGHGVFEVLAQFDEPVPGTGVYFGDEHGTPKYQVAFFREQRTGRTSLGPLNPNDGRTESNHDIATAPAPLVVDRPWIRLLFGSGTLRCWTSSDGVHWARAFDPATNQPGNFRTFGLFCTPGEPRRSIKLRHLKLRELGAINGLASRELRRQVAKLPETDNFDAWLKAVDEMQPKEAKPDHWRRACAIRTLARGTNAGLGRALIENLLDDAFATLPPPDNAIQILDDAALLLPTWEDANIALRLAQRYERLGQMWHRQGETRPYQRIAHAQRTAPLWSRGTYNFIPDSLIRDELLELTQADRWANVRDLCQQVRFWRPPEPHQQPTLFDWAEGLAGQSLPKRAGATIAAFRGEWRHPLISEWSKEGYNVLAELQAALDGQAYEDACQIISTIDNNNISGVLPDSRDPQLLVSVSNAISLAMREHPSLQATMAAQFEPRGQLRVRQAVAEGNALALQAATLQFHGTRAAAEAHAWLGDRALSAGAFAQALGHYRQAKAWAGPELQNRLSASIQLAAALMGKTVEEPVAAAVEFGEAHLSPAEVTNLASDLRKTRATQSVQPGTSVAAASWPSVPAPTGFEAAHRGRLEGEGGESPQNVPGELNQFDIDWAAKQCAVTSTDARIIVSNRFHVASYDVNSGQFQWRTGLGGEQAPAHEWSLVPMRPLVVGSLVFVRRLPKPGPVLSCLEIETGKIVWTTKPERDTYIVSDPLWIQDELFALRMTRVDQEFDLSLATFDLQTGAVLSEYPLARFRDTWWQQRSCEVTAIEDRLIVNCGGSVLCCDLQGQVRWLRRMVWVPPKLDRSFMAQTHDRPLVHDGRLYVAMPGVRNVSCLDPDSGRLIWRRVLPDVRRMIGIDDQRLIVQVENGLVALDAGDGTPRWHRDVVHMLETAICAPTGGVLFAQRERFPEGNDWRPVLVWLQAETGRERGRFALDNLRHDRPKFGPLHVANNRVWTFFGRGEQDPNRDIFELVAKGPASPPTSEDSEQRPWKRQ